MKIALDAMGADQGVRVAVEAAFLAVKNLNIEVVLVGRKEELDPEVQRFKRRKEFALERRVSIRHAADVIKMDQDEVASIVRYQRDASINVAMRMVKDGEVDALVSPANTGAVVASAILNLRRIKGINHPAIALILPNDRGKFLFLDVGAISDCKPLNLEQFAVMGSVFVEKVQGVAKPRVGLFNIGEEPSKGNELTKTTYDLLRKNSRINFVGNVEGNHLPAGVVDVVVTDGFTGNAVLKSLEGMGEFVKTKLKGKLLGNPLYWIPGLWLLPGLRRTMRELQYQEYGGARLLGVNGVVLVSHGRSDSHALVKALEEASVAVKSGFLATMRSEFADSREEERFLTPA